MSRLLFRSALLTVFLLFFLNNAAAEVCEGFGPQTPRDIDSLAGENKRLFSIAPNSTEMNLCNIHFHTHAEHKAKDFSIYAGAGDKGYGGGYQLSLIHISEPTRPY